MKVKIGNKIFDSYDQPIAVLLTSDEEIETAKRLGGRARVIGSFPNTMSNADAMLFMNTDWGDMSFKVQYDVEAALYSIEIPGVPKIGVAQNG